MDALFFLARREDATGVAASDDLPAEPVTDALRLQDPSPLIALAEVLRLEAKLRPLRDATCRSFPVWELGGELLQRIAALDDDEIDTVGGQWRKHAGASLDADLYELTSCLTDLRDAARSRDVLESLFVLLEERAW